jgi:cell wall-associated NlpC family hydrolase
VQRGIVAFAPGPLKLALGLGLAGVLAASVPCVSLAAPPSNPDDTEIEAADETVELRLSEIAGLIDRIARADDELAQLDALVATKREAVNKALVDYQAAQAEADRAAGTAASARQQLDESGAAIADAQERFDDIAAANYRQGSPSDSLEAFADASGPEDVLFRAEAMRRLGAEQQSVVDELERARTASANHDSIARADQRAAEVALAVAAELKTVAEQAIAEAVNSFEQAQTRRSQLASEREGAQLTLQAAREAVAGLRSQRDAYEQWEAQEQARAAAQAQAAAAPAAGQAQGTGAPHSAAAPLEVPAAAPFPELPSVDVGTIFDTLMTGSLGQVIDPGTPPPTTTPPTTPPPTTNPPTTTPGVPGGATRAEKIEIVVERALSQLGVPYAWGGGNHAGPTLGIRDGGVADAHGDYRKIGFDCSGLTMYAFAGVGILLPHYSGYQYQMGTKVPSSQMQRGDLLFYGAGGSQHVTLYLGDGQVVEAPQSGMTVRIAPVNWYGLLPHVVRLI